MSQGLVRPVEIPPATCNQPAARGQSERPFRNASFVTGTRLSARVVSLDDPIVISDSANALLASLWAAADTMQDATSFAYAISPVLAAASGLTDDSVVVQAAVAVALSSTEYWESETNQSTAYSTVRADLIEGCGTGEYQGDFYTVDGNTFTCDGGSWLVSELAHGLSVQKSIFRFASLAKTRKGCDDYEQGGVAFKTIAIADIEGGLFGVRWGIQFGGWGVLIGGLSTAAMASMQAGGWFYTIRTVCGHFL